MAKIQMRWVDTGWCSFQVEVPQTKMAFERTENKRISQQIRQLNRNQQRIVCRQFGKVR